MTKPADRLREARSRAGFDTAKGAAEALGFPVSTYLCHENGTRGISAKRAVSYARKYDISEQWLLYGFGDRPGSEQGREVAEINRILERLSPTRRAEALAILRVISDFAYSNEITNEMSSVGGTVVQPHLSDPN